MQKIGGQIRSLRLRQTLSQAELAARSGVNHGQLSRIESGRVLPRYETLEALAASLGAAVVLVPLDVLSDVEGLIGTEADPYQPVGTAFDDLFIPDPGDAEP